MSSRNRKTRRPGDSSRQIHSYDSLESRHLLTVDLGFAITTELFDEARPVDTPDVNGDIGPNHIVQATNSGFTVRARSGEVLQTSEMQFFWQSAGADIQVGTDIFGNAELGQIEDTRVVFDHDSQRWFVASSLAGADGDNLFGNDVLLAVSRSDNPVDGFRSIQFLSDIFGESFNASTTLAVTGDGVIVTVKSKFNVFGENTVSVFAFPKADLLTENPTSVNLARFQNLSPAMYGDNLQFATDLNADSNSIIGVGTFDNSNQLSILTITNLTTADPAELNNSTAAVPFYDNAPAGRQPNAVDPLNNISPEITGSVVSQGGFIYAVHSIEGSDENSAIRWYQIDEATGFLANSGTIEDVDVDYLYPSISVSEAGIVAIGFTGTGLQQAPSSMVTMGFLARGLNVAPTLTFPQDPVIIQAGADNLENTDINGTNPFGEFTATRVDPLDPYSFYTYQQYVNSVDTWGTTLSESGITDISPVINGDATPNILFIRRSETDSNLIEVELDGFVTDVYELTSLDSLEFNLGDGSDVVVIDYSFGAVLTQFGITINGQGGADVLSVVDSAGHQFDITGDGSGTLDLINTFTGFEVINGTDSNDVFTAANTTTGWLINGNGGDDLFDIANSATGIFTLNGMDGDDRYRVPIFNFDTITVNDGPDEN
ncbi:MAG: hypothetical protein AAGA30_07170, partial [Planctomycetota bacterium]